MKLFYLAAFLFVSLVAKGQDIIEWNDQYTLQLSDFQSPSTQTGGVNSFSIYCPATFDFSFAMTNAEFLFTKNFNSKASCKLNRKAALIIAPDTEVAAFLVNFGRYEFDLCELYTRKFRKSLYENKGAFSNANFFQPIFNELQNEYVVRLSNAQQLTDIGRSTVRLNELHEEVKKEIGELAEFCKTCKPSKKKKKVRDM